MSTDVWSNHWIGLEKLPQNDPWHFEIRPLDQKLWIYSFSMSADVYNDLTIGLALKNYPKMIPNLPHSFLSTNDPLWGEEGG